MNFDRLALIILMTLSCFAISHTLAGPAKGLSNTGIELRDDLQQLLQNAFEAYRQKKYPEALELCEKAIAKAPSDHRAYTIKGLVLMAQWKMKEASAAFSKSIAIKSDIKETHFYKATSDRFNNDFEAALEACRRAIEIDPKYAEAYALKGEILRNDKERKQEAVEAFQSAIKYKPGYLKAYVALGETFGYDDEFEAAEKVLRDAINRDPKKMAGRFELGRLLVEQGKLKEARDLWEARNSDEDKTFPNFITLLERAERLEEARLGIEKLPDDPDANLSLGIAVMDGDHWVVDGRQKKAIVYFQKALELRPGFVEAQFQICRAYIQIADTDETENENVNREIEKLRKLDPDRAKEIEEYRKTYKGGFQIASPSTSDN